MKLLVCPGQLGGPLLDPQLQLVVGGPEGILGLHPLQGRSELHGDSFQAFDQLERDRVHPVVGHVDQAEDPVAQPDRDEGNRLVPELVAHVACLAPLRFGEFAQEATRSVHVEGPARCVEGKPGIGLPLDHVDAHALVPPNRKAAFDSVELRRKTHRILIRDVAFLVQDAHAHGLAPGQLLYLGHELLEQWLHFGIAVCHFEEAMGRLEGLLGLLLQADGLLQLEIGLVQVPRQVCELVVQGGDAGDDLALCEQGPLAEEDVTPFRLVHIADEAVRGVCASPQVQGKPSTALVLGKGKGLQALRREEGLQVRPGRLLGNPEELQETLVAARDRHLFIDNNDQDVRERLEVLVQDGRTRLLQQICNHRYGIKRRRAGRV